MAEDLEFQRLIEKSKILFFGTRAYIYQPGNSDIDKPDNIVELGMDHMHVSYSDEEHNPDPAEDKIIFQIVVDCGINTCAGLGQGMGQHLKRLIS